MVFRKGNSGLFGRAAKTAARTALITATATTVANGMSRGRSGDAAPAEPVQSPQAGGASADVLARLEKLAEMHKSGILTDGEFAEQKARLLA